MLEGLGLRELLDEDLVGEVVGDAGYEGVHFDFSGEGGREVGCKRGGAFNALEGRTFQNDWRVPESLLLIPWLNVFIITGRTV